MAIIASKDGEAAATHRNRAAAIRKRWSMAYETDAMTTIPSPPLRCVLLRDQSASTAPVQVHRLQRVASKPRAGRASDAAAPTRTTKELLALVCSSSRCLADFRQLPARTLRRNPCVTCYRKHGKGAACDKRGCSRAEIQFRLCFGFGYHNPLELEMFRLMENQALRNRDKKPQGLRRCRVVQPCAPVFPWA